MLLSVLIKCTATLETCPRKHTLNPLASNRRSLDKASLVHFLHSNYYLGKLRGRPWIFPPATSSLSLHHPEYIFNVKSVHRIEVIASNSFRYSAIKNLLNQGDLDRDQQISHDECWRGLSNTQKNLHRSREYSSTSRNSGASTQSRWIMADA